MAELYGENDVFLSPTFTSHIFVYLCKQSEHRQGWTSLVCGSYARLLLSIRGVWRMSFCLSVLSSWVQWPALRPSYIQDNQGASLGMSHLGITGRHPMSQIFFFDSSTLFDYFSMFLSPSPLSLFFISLVQTPSRPNLKRILTQSPTPGKHLPPT